MDLLVTVRKEGSRGGRGDFKWSDVQGSSRRENYLGHSVMAPVGRWQKGKDLNWYAKGDKDAENEETRKRKEELKRVREAEQDAMARALGLPVPDRTNANLEELGSKRQFEQVAKGMRDEEITGEVRGVGFSRGTVGTENDQILEERIEGNAEGQDKELQYALKEYRRRHGDSNRSEQNRSRRRERDHRNGHRSRERMHSERHRQSSGTKEPVRRKRSQSRSDSRSRLRSRSRSGSRSPRHHDYRDRKDRRKEDDRRHQSDRHQRRKRSRSPYRR